jgi:hypothetical protein
LREAFDSLSSQFSARNQVCWGTQRRGEYGKGAKALLIAAALFHLLFLYPSGIRMKDEGEEGEKFRRVFAPFLSFFAPLREAFDSLSSQFSARNQVCWGTQRR